MLTITYRYKNMGIVNVLWSGISILVVVSAGMIFFDEKITPLDQIGIVLVIIGIACIMWEGQHDGFRGHI
jgi:multidrug transporter EmrE-like cation transporter